ncbi:hypothetical protein ABT298_32170 [Streptomyces sp. NPDC001034]
MARQRALNCSCGFFIRRNSVSHSDCPQPIGKDNDQPLLLHFDGHA